MPVGDLNVRGQSPDPATWSYECTLNGPDTSITRSVPEEGVVHVKYSTDPGRPWRGVGPLARSNLDAALLAALTTRMAEEAGASSALVIPSPVDGAADSTTTLRSDHPGGKARGVPFDGRKPTVARIWGSVQSAPAKDLVGEEARAA